MRYSSSSVFDKLHKKGGFHFCQVMKDTNIKYDVILIGCKNRLGELDPLINYYYYYYYYYY